MRRSQLVRVVVYCPNRQQPIVALRNIIIDRLVSCENESCRGEGDRASAVECAARPRGHSNPKGCPISPEPAD